MIIRQMVSMGASNSAVAFMVNSKSFLRAASSCADSAERDWRSLAKVSMFCWRLLVEDILSSYRLEKPIAGLTFQSEV